MSLLDLEVASLAVTAAVLLVAVALFARSRPR